MRLFISLNKFARNGRLALSILLTVVSVQLIAAPQTGAAASLCEPLFRALPFRDVRVRSEQEMTELKFLAWNVQQLAVKGSNARSRFNDQGLAEARRNRDSNRNGKNEQSNNHDDRHNKGNRHERELPPKTEEEIAEIRRIISEQDPDIAVLAEVDNLEALQVLATKELSDYRPLLVPGNDIVIDIGFLVKKDLPWDITLVSHKKLRRIDPNGHAGPMFARDLPVLEFRRQPTDPDPLFVVIGNHAKSKRSTPGDDQSISWRTDHYKAAAIIVEEYLRRGIRVMMGGDMNADLYRDAELDPVLKLLVPSLGLAGVPREEQVTHTYHPDGRNKVERSTMDEWLLSKGLRVVRGWVVRYKGADGKTLPLPDSYEARERQPSDHFPVYTVVSTAEIFGQAPKNP